nr:glycosyltransferase family 2 protein [Lachnospiraceae bacterium]
MEKKEILLTDEYNRVFAKLKKAENFTLLRYGDGERSIMTGVSVTAQEGWKSPEGQTSLGEALNRTLSVLDERVLYGISCPCCDRSAYYWYMSHIPSKNITFANLFVNYNYRRFQTNFEELTRDAIVIGNYRGKDKKIGNLNVLDYYSVGDDCISFWENDAPKLIQDIINDYGERENLLYVVSAGPMAEPIIYELFKNNPNNCYIDFGSAIDCYIHNRDTRPYTNIKSIYANRNCYMYEPQTTNFDVSVVLTAYKKPEALKKQLDAVMNQTLKPKEIFLFQDGIEKEYTINFTPELLKQFDDVKISSVNMGVWERFRYAQSVNSELVCIFDDDTIPGQKWLENCHFHMMKEEGVYGTVGIVLDKHSTYPDGGYFKVGWRGPCSELGRVDFVGHSWFMKKKYLDYMFDHTEKYQTFKYVAEDMCLSFMCEKKGIHTFVPPHPYWDMELWGSKPEFGMKFGEANTAVSINRKNWKDMYLALETFKQAGWKLVIETDRKHVKHLYRTIRYEKY